jgi:hypothetical protein
MKIDLEERLINPPSGSALEAARNFGIDLSLLAERLRLSPEERLRDLQQVMLALEQIHGVARSRRD